MILHILIFLLFFYYLYLVSAKNILNPLTIYLYNYFVLVYGGVVAYDIYYHNDFTIQAEVYYITKYGIICTLIFGILIYSFVLKGKVINTNSYRLNNQISYRSENLIFIILSIILFLYFLYATGFNFLNPEHHFDRVSKQAGFGYLKILIISLIFVSTPLFFYNNISLGIKIVLFLISLIILLGFGFRAQAIKFMLLLFFSYYAITKKDLQLKKLFIIGLSLYSLIVIIGILRLGITENYLDFFLRRFLWRPFITLDNFNALYESFNQDSVEFLYGKSILYDLSTVIPGAGKSSLVYYNELVGAIDFKGATITPSINGILYSNFGLLGVIILTPIIPFFFLIVGAYLYNKKSITKDRLILYIFVIISIKGTATTGIILSIIFQIIPFYVLYLIKVNLKKLIIYVNSTNRPLDVKDNTF